MRIAIVGSGPAGTAAAVTLLESGCQVEMLDVGHCPEEAAMSLASELRHRVAFGKRRPTPDQNNALWHGRKAHESTGLLQSLQELFGGSVPGENGRIVRKRIFGSHFAYAGVDEGIPQEGPYELNRSLAYGGLSNVWGAACYPLRRIDYEDWPIDESQIAPFYQSASQLLGLEKKGDALEQLYPSYANARPEGPWRPNPGSAAEAMLARWTRNAKLLQQAGWYGGRSNLAVRFGVDAATPEDEPGCRRCGGCLFGCPFQAIFISRHTVEKLKKNPKFRYIPNQLVLRFEEVDDGVRAISRHWRDHTLREERYDRIILAAGTVSTFRIVADSLQAHDVPTPIIDNDLFVLPFLWSGSWIGGAFQSAFPMSEAAVAIKPASWTPRGFHLQFYSYHPFFLGGLGLQLQRLPGRLSRLTQSVLNNLIIGFIYPDDRQSRQATLSVRANERQPGTVVLRMEDENRGRQALETFLRHMKTIHGATGLTPLTFMTKSGPFGLSGHLGGTLAMHRHPDRLQTDPQGRLAQTRHVYIADASTFPTMPPQNPTLTVMANAMRIADASRRSR